MVSVPKSEIQITIVCDGEPLPEYAHQVKDMRATCFIPSEEGKTFQIHAEWPKGSQSNHFKLCVSLDGAPVIQRMIVKKPETKTTLIGPRAGPQTRKLYSFGRMQLAMKEDAVNLDEARMKALSTIRVTVKYIEFTGRDVGMTFRDLDKQRIGPISEEAKKGGGHLVILGDTFQTKKKTKMPENRRLKLPHHEVIFHYAPLAVLQAREIIPLPPRQPSPLPLPTASSSASVPNGRLKREREDDAHSDASGDFSDPDEAAAFARLKAKSIAKKKARTDLLVKPEALESSSRIFKKGEVIDLTGDD